MSVNDIMKHSEQGEHAVENLGVKRHELDQLSEKATKISYQLVSLYAYEQTGEQKPSGHEGNSVDSVITNISNLDLATAVRNHAVTAGIPDLLPKLDQRISQFGMENIVPVDFKSTSAKAVAPAVAKSWLHGH